MRRSRSALVFFFASFMASLLGVGLADGGHDSTGKPADLYRVDLDNPADGWSCITGGWCDRGLASDLERAAAVAQPSECQGWAFLQHPFSPLAAVIYIDDDMACYLTWLADSAPAADVAALETFPVTAPAAELAAEDFDGSELDAGIIDGCWPHADAGDEFQLAIVDAPAAEADDVVAARAALAYAGSLNGGLAWQVAIDAATRCEISWENYDAYPDASVAGWVDEVTAFRTAQIWNSIGRTLAEVAQRLVNQRDQALQAASRQLVGWVRAAQIQESQASAARISHPRSWPNVGRSTGAFLSL